jgi:hypothetical protein
MFIVLTDLINKLSTGALKYATSSFHGLQNPSLAMYRPLPPIQFYAALISEVKPRINLSIVNITFNITSKYIRKPSVFSPRENNCT